MLGSGALPRRLSPSCRAGKSQFGCFVVKTTLAPGRGRDGQGCGSGDSLGTTRPPPLQLEPLLGVGRGTSAVNPEVGPYAPSLHPPRLSLPLLPVGFPLDIISEHQLWNQLEPPCPCMTSKVRPREGKTMARAPQTAVGRATLHWFLLIPDLSSFSYPEDFNNPESAWGQECL